MELVALISAYASLSTEDELGAPKIGPVKGQEQPGPLSAPLLPASCPCWSLV